MADCVDSHQCSIDKKSLGKVGMTVLTNDGLICFVFVFLGVHSCHGNSCGLNFPSHFLSGNGDISFPLTDAL